MRSHTARASFTTRVAYPMLTRLVPILLGVALLGLLPLMWFPEAKWISIVHLVAIAIVLAALVACAVLVLIQDIRVRRGRKKGPIMTIRNKPDDTVLVPVVHLSGDDYDAAVDLSEGDLTTLESVHTVIAHMAQWDYDEETDGAAAINGLNTLGELKALPHDLDEHHHAGTDYLMLSDAGLRFCALYRELPADNTEQEADHG